MQNQRDSELFDLACLIVLGMSSDYLYRYEDLRPTKFQMDEIKAVMTRLGETDEAIWKGEEAEAFSGEDRLPPTERLY